MFEKMRQRRAEKLMNKLDNTPVTDETVKQRDTLVEKLGRNGVVQDYETQEYVSLPEKQPLRPMNRPGTPVIGLALNFTRSAASSRYILGKQGEML